MSETSEEDQSEDFSGSRRRYYIDPEVQFPIIVGTLILTTVMGLFLGWGFYKLIAISKHWQNANQVGTFFLVLLGTLVPAVLINFAFGVFISNKIAGPLYKIRNSINEITRGNLESDVSIRKGDMLQSHVIDYNRMVGTLRRLLYRDHRHSTEVNEIMTDCQSWLEKNKTNFDDKSRKELQKIINDAKARLSIINTHFLKGLREKP